MTSDIRFCRQYHHLHIYYRSHYSNVIQCVYSNNRTLHFLQLSTCYFELLLSLPSLQKYRQVCSVSGQLNRPGDSITLIISFTGKKGERAEKAIVKKTDSSHSVPNRIKLIASGLNSVTVCLWMVISGRQLLAYLPAQRALPFWASTLVGLVFPPSALAGNWKVCLVFSSPSPVD